MTTLTSGAGGLPSGPEIVRFIDSSRSHFVLQIVYSRGATLRDGLDIDSSHVVRNVPYGTLLEASERAITQEGVSRFRTRDGWLSEHLRGDSPSRVLQVRTII